MKKRLQNNFEASDAELFNAFKEICSDEETCRIAVKESQNLTRQLVLLEMQAEALDRDDLIYIFNAA